MVGSLHFGIGVERPGGKARGVDGEKTMQDETKGELI